MIWALNVRGDIDSFDGLLLLGCGAIGFVIALLWILVIDGLKSLMSLKTERGPLEREKRKKREQEKQRMRHLRRQQSDEMGRFRDLQDPEDEQVVEAFLIACRHDTPERIHEFLNLGVDVNLTNEDGQTPLFSAARTNENPEVITTLIKAGADVNAKDRYGDTPLHDAAPCNKNTEVLTALIKAGADVNAKDNYGSTPLDAAINSYRHKNPEVLRAAGGKRGFLLPEPYPRDGGVLCIHRRRGEEVVVGDPASPLGVVKVEAIMGDRVRLAFVFRKDNVTRGELVDDHPWPVR